MPIPAQTGARVKVASTPTTIKAAPAPKVANPTPATKIGTPILTGGAAGHAGVGAVAGKADFSTTYVATTLQTARVTKAATVAVVAGKTTNGHTDYR